MTKRATAKPAGGGEPADTDADQRLAMVYVGARWRELAAILDASMSVDKKLWQIHCILPIPPTTSARTIAQALKVTPAAVVQTAWWRHHRCRKPRFFRGKRHAKRPGRGHRRAPAGPDSQEPPSDQEPVTELD